MRISGNLVFILIIAILIAGLVGSGLLVFFPSQLIWKWTLMLVLWLALLIFMVLLLRRLLRGRKMPVKVVGIVLGVTLNLVSLVYCVGSCATDFDQSHVETLLDAETGIRLEVYDYALHDHIGMELYWGDHRWPVVWNFRFYDDFNAGNLVNLGGGKVRLENELNRVAILMDIRTGVESYLETHE